MRCPDCNKFVPLDVDGDPEVELEADETTGEVTGTVRIVNACQECGTELTESTFDVDVEFPAAAEHMEKYPEDEAHALELVDPDISRTERREGRGRGVKTFYGAETDSGGVMAMVVRCRCGFEERQSWSDEVQASSMDQLN